MLLSMTDALRRTWSHMAYIGIVVVVLSMRCRTLAYFAFGLMCLSTAVFTENQILGLAALLAGSLVGEVLGYQDKIKVE